ncbi:hypothetical protein MOB39_21510 [Bacillus spizizenii]|nr:hypothetical protein [Bacillus spizizenii]
MTFEKVCGLFTQVEGIEDSFLLLSDEDNYYIALSDFKQLFEGEYDEGKPYESLITSTASSPAWNEIWDNFNSEDLFN